MPIWYIHVVVTGSMAFARNPEYIWVFNGGGGDGGPVRAAGGLRAADGGTGGPAARADATAESRAAAAAVLLLPAGGALAVGTCTIAWHLGHFPRLPASSSLTFSEC